MKRFTILLLLTTIICRSSLHAQITKGSFFTGGNIGGAYQRVEAYTNDVPLEQKGFTISPVFGKVIKDNFVLGIDAGLSLFNTKNSPNYDNKSQLINTYTAGIFVRQYKPLGGGFYLFLQERLGYKYEKYDNSAGTLNIKNYKRHTVALTAYPGISYAVSKRLHLETGFNNLFYINYSYENGSGYDARTSNYKSNSYNAGADLNAFSSLYIGVRIFLTK